MIVLVIDTSCGRSSLVAYDYSGILASETSDPAVQQSEMLPEMLSAISLRTGLKMEGLKGIAVVAGPGSFTGLRVGLSFAKGLSLLCDTPLLPLNSLDSMAWAITGTEGMVSPMLDARKNQIYTALYKVGKGEVERVSEYVACDPESWLRSLPTGTLITGNGVLKYQSLCSRFVELNAAFRHIDGPTIDGLVRISRHLEKTCNWVSAGELDAFYIRPPDAVAAVK